jgi:hypothetical protein
MNKTLSIILTVTTVIVLAGVIFFAGSMYARATNFGPSMMYGWNDNNAYGPNMMNGRGPSMMDGNAYGPGGMMGNGRNMTLAPGASAGVNGYGYDAANITPLTVDQTRAAAEKYLAELNNSDLEIAEVMVFDNNGYAIVREASTGIGAFELLVDPVSQVAYPEHGPNMMWNLKYSRLNHENMTLAPGASAGVGGNGYGMMGGWMMRGYGNTMMQGWDDRTSLDVDAEMTVTPEQAVEYTQQYLDANIPGAATEHPMQFYGYYTLDFEKDGEIAGMLSVNGYNGQVFLHIWHGTFIEEAEYE